jgi:XTP/dITP diphosphohydrolase
MKLVFATNNEFKLKEIRQIFESKIGNEIEILSLKDIGCSDDIEETASTIEGNAILKAKYVYDKFGLSCFADDTGLEVEALNGAPGVYSARYASDHDTDANVTKLLENMKGVYNREAKFHTVACLILNGRKYIVDGSVEGDITEEPRGTEGFGYDCVFVPMNYDKTFAELGDEVKNKISQRRGVIDGICEILSAKKKK